MTKKSSQLAAAKSCRTSTHTGRSCNQSYHTSQLKRIRVCPEMRLQNGVMLPDPMESHTAG